MDKDPTAAMQPDAADVRAADEAVPVEEQGTDSDRIASGRGEDAEPDELAFEQPEADPAPAETDSDAKARALADWVARVREHAPSLLSDEPGNVSTPPVTERPNAGPEREPEAVGPASELARAAQTPSDTADLTQRDIPEEDHERQRPSEAPARKSADAPPLAIAAVADESPERSDVTYSATPPSPVSRASNDSGEREPSSDHRAREGGADRADAVVPRIPTLAEAAGRSDDPPDREEIPQRSLAPLPRESSAREAHAERTRIDEGSGLAQALHQLTPDLTAFPSRSVTAGMTDLTQIMPIGDDVARTAGFARPLLKDAQRGDRWITP